MKIETVNRGQLTRNGRLDSSYYLSEGALAINKVNSFLKRNEYMLLGDKNIANVWQPNRNVLVYAGEDEEYIPYIQPYDILEYLPEERAKLSSNQGDNDVLRVKSGTILQTCSGRNLGPLIVSDNYLERFIIGSDLIRIEVFDPRIRNYVFAFFSTWIGQAMLHSNKTGSVIDHLSKKDIEKIKIPLLDEIDISRISDKIKMSLNAFSTARDTLHLLKSRFNKEVGVHREKFCLADGWSCSLKSLTGNARIDAAFYDPVTMRAAEQMKSMRGVKLSDVADVVKPSGRYKTNYTDKAHGMPLISGRQLLQNQVVGMKYLPHGLKDDFRKYQLNEAEIAYPADGRVEGRLGTPVYITNSRNGWFASGHVGRIRAHDGVCSGYLYLAMTHQVVQAQIYSLACGSVVDAVYPEDVENIIIPKMIKFPYDEVVQAWNMFDKAEILKKEACDILLNSLELRE